MRWSISASLRCRAAWPEFSPFHLLFAGLMGGAVLVWPPLCLFIVPELAWGVAQWLPFQRLEQPAGASLTPLAPAVRGT
ncbi:hypothetical protein [Duganella qianjiadongensis]|uniref:Uncharacterized protein n=1 Tax=Duganella qianjiadongensis TaxID=2692176 RepID=A0ABW9VKI3_9BURK|nr:hypothetical protein [Duganella qianjiadongensis]MYM39160.1 hypothetical protein [Duganella qianjiadongensis]